MKVAVLLAISLVFAGCSRINIAGPQLSQTIIVEQPTAPTPAVPEPIVKVDVVETQPVVTAPTVVEVPVVVTVPGIVAPSEPPTVPAVPPVTPPVNCDPQPTHGKDPVHECKEHKEKK